MLQEQHGAPLGSLEDSRYSGKGLPEQGTNSVKYKHGQIKQGRDGFTSSNIASSSSFSMLLFQKNTTKIILHLADLT